MYDNVYTLIWNKQTQKQNTNVLKKCFITANYRLSLFFGVFLQEIQYLDHPAIKTMC